MKLQFSVVKIEYVRWMQCMYDYVENSRAAPVMILCKWKIETEVNCAWTVPLPIMRPFSRCKEGGIQFGLALQNGYSYVYKSG